MALSEISIEITNACHQHCLHCSSSAGKPFEDELTLEEIKDILRQAKELGAHIFTISGGDPLLREDIHEIITSARQQGFEIRLQTSGTYKGPITDEFLDFFSENIKDRIVYSVHGLKSTHDKITQTEGSFDTVMESIRRTRAKGITTEAHMAANKLNFKDIEELSKTLDLHLLRTVPQGDCDKNLMMNKQEFKETQETLTRSKAHIGHNLDKRHWSDQSLKINSCSLGEDKMLIRANGNFTYCAALKHIPFGNIRDKSLAYLWNEHPSAKAFRKFLKEDYKDLKGKCSTCELLERCKGGCIAQRIHSYGDMMQGPDPKCYKK
ncbi:MAG: radical SAM protein [archaeon]